MARHVYVDADAIMFPIGVVCQEESPFAPDGLAVDYTKSARLVVERMELLRDELTPDYLSTCFSDPERNFRKELWPGYKANREGREKPKTYPQMTRTLKTYGPWIQKPGLEADDCVGIFGTQAADEGHEVVVVSHDKDFRTIPGVYFYRLKPHTIGVSLAEEMVYQTEEEADRYWWKQILMGDATDGYKGLPGIGEVKAEKMLEGIEDLGGVVEAYLSRGLTFEDFEMNARMSRILRAEDWINKQREMIPGS